MDSTVADISSAGNFLNTCISFPRDAKYIGTPLPFVVFHIKNMNKFVAVEVQVQDDTGAIR